MTDSNKQRAETSANLSTTYRGSGDRLVSSKVHSSDLLSRANPITIVHNGKNYTLRITSKNKLILN